MSGNQCTASAAGAAGTAGAATAAPSSKAAKDCRPTVLQRIQRDRARRSGLASFRAVSVRLLAVDARDSRVAVLRWLLLPASLLYPSSSSSYSSASLLLPMLLVTTLLWSVSVSSR